MFKKTANSKSRHCLVLIVFFLSFLIGSNPVSAKQAKASGKSQRTLTIYNWEEYIGKDTLKNFQKETGILAKEIYFEDEEEILGALVSTKGQFDLVVTSGDYSRELTMAKLLSKLDYSKIPNIKFIGKQYLHRWFDPKQEYSVPYLLGTTGMAINKKYIKENTHSWKVLFDKRYKGRMAMLNNSWEVAAVACKTLGYSINTIDPERLNKARVKLFEQKPLLTGYHDAVSIQEMLIKEELWAAQIYSGEGLAAVDENENLEYVIPMQGAAKWFDCFVIPKSSKHKEEAYAFLNYILRPEINAAIASEFWYATPNEAAKALMDQEVLQSPSVYPSTEVDARCEFFNNAGHAANSIINRIWSDLTVED